MTNDYILSGDRESELKTAIVHCRTVKDLIAQHCATMSAIAEFLLCASHRICVHKSSSNSVRNFIILPGESDRKRLRVIVGWLRWSRWLLAVTLAAMRANEQASGLPTHKVLSLVASWYCYSARTGLRHAGHWRHVVQLWYVMGITKWPEKVNHGTAVE